MSTLEEGIQYSQARTEVECAKRRHEAVRNFYGFLERLPLTTHAAAALHDPLHLKNYELPQHRIGEYCKLLWACFLIKQYPIVFERRELYSNPVINVAMPAASLNNYLRALSRALFRGCLCESETAYRYNVFTTGEGFAVQVSSLKTSALTRRVGEWAKAAAEKMRGDAELAARWFAREYRGSIEVRVSPIPGESDLDVDVGELYDTPIALEDLSLNGGEPLGDADDGLEPVDFDALNELLGRSAVAAQVSELLSIPQMAFALLTPVERSKVLSALASIKAKPLADSWCKHEIPNDEWKIVQLGTQRVGYIHYLTKHKNPAQYTETIRQSELKQIRAVINRRSGLIAHMDVAELIRQKYGDRMWWSDELKAWGCMTLESSEPRRLFKIKLRVSDNMHDFTHFIVKLREHGDTIVNGLKSEQAEATDTAEAKRLSKLIGGVDRLISRCGDVNFVRGATLGARALMVDDELKNKLDADGTCIGIRGGILRLARWEGSVFHEPELVQEANSFYVSKSADVDYDPDNEWIAKWEQVHQDVVPEDDARFYIQTSLCTMLDDTSNTNCLLVIKAGGSNGKTTLTDTAMQTLPEHVVKGDIQIFTTAKRDSNSADNAMMQIKGKRGMIFSETRADTVILGDQLKHVVGIEAKNGRANYGDKETFVAHCTMIATTNHYLKLDDSDFGCWRRLAYYEAHRKFVKNPDPNIEDERLIDSTLEEVCTRDLRARSGLFTLLVQKHTEYMRVYRGQFAEVPRGPTIEAMTERVRVMQDVVSQFFAAVLYYVPGEALPLDELGREFGEWLARRGDRRPMSSVQVANTVSNSCIEKEIVTVGKDRYLPHAVLVHKCQLDDGSVTLPPGARPYTSVPRAQRIEAATTYARTHQPAKADSA